MKFSLWNLKEWYEVHGLDLSYHITESDASISMLAVSDTAAEGRLGCAIVELGEHCPDCSGFHTVLSFGRDRILFPVASPADVLDLGASMIEVFRQWENRLLDRIESGSPLSMLYPIFQERFPFPLLVLHPDGSVFSRSPNWKSPTTAAFVQSMLQPASQTRQPCFRTLMLEPPQVFISEPLDFHPGQSGALVTYEDQKKMQPGDLQLFHEIATIYELALRFHMNETISIHPLSGWLSTVLDAPENSLPVPIDLLAQSGWQKEGSFLFAAVQPLDGKTPPSELTAALTDQAHCCVPVSDLLCVLIHLSGGTTIQSEIELLRQRCSSARSCAGLSLLFQPLEKLPQFYQQSVLAVETARKEKLDVFAVQSDLPRVLRTACHTLKAAQTLIHPAIQRIAELERREGDQLLKTLYVYLITGQAVVQTANRLFVHRNTIRCRLHKIDAAADIRWEDSEECEQLLLSLLLDTPEAS